VNRCPNSPAGRFGSEVRETNLAASYSSRNKGSPPIRSCDATRRYLHRRCLRAWPTTCIPRRRTDYSFRSVTREWSQIRTPEAAERRTTTKSPRFSRNVRILLARARQKDLRLLFATDKLYAASGHWAVSAFWLFASPVVTIRRSCGFFQMQSRC